MKDFESFFPSAIKERQNEQENIAYDGMSDEKIEENIELIKRNFDVDISRDDIVSVRPGDILFDKNEIQYQLDLDTDEFREKIESHGYDPDDVKLGELRDIAEKEGITLKGELPGFALTEQGGKIIFFAVKESNVIGMAEKYARKEGGEDLSFSNTQEAAKYLEGLSDKVFFHEGAHIIFDRLRQAAGNNGWNEFFDKWKDFIDSNPEIQQAVEELQQDKYPGQIGKDIIYEEAFADFAVDVFSGRKITSRLEKNKLLIELGKNEEAKQIIGDYLRKKNSN